MTLPKSESNDQKKKIKALHKSSRKARLPANPINSKNEIKKIIPTDTHKKVKMRQS